MPACRVTDSEHNAPRTGPGIPGTLLAIQGRGLLITGESGAGKSLLALGLLDRGHALVSDDLVEIQAEGGALNGYCPEVLQGRLEVRGVGLVDVRRLFGPQAWCRHIRIDHVLHLQPAIASEVWPAWPRPDGQRDHLTLQGVRLPRLTLPASGDGVSPLLVETALRHELPTAAGGTDNG